MLSRRQLLARAGAGAAGLAVGSVVTGSVVHDTDQGTRRAAASVTAADREEEDGAGAGTTPMRLGVRSVFWNASPVSPRAALTFDDGPTPAYTPRILDALDRQGLRATFFVMGHNALAHPSLLREVVAAGHELGTHTWSHLDQALLPPARIREEIVRGKDAVEQVVQQPLAGFRPPRGELTGHALVVCAELGYDVILYSCTRGPAGISTVAAVAASIGSSVGSGDIVDLHDGLGRGTFAPAASFARALAARREVEVRALPEALRRIADRGIALTTVRGLLGRTAPSTPGGTSGPDAGTSA